MREQPSTACQEAVDILWLLIAYKNLDEVDDYIDHLDHIKGDSCYRYAICDNSPTSGRSRHEGRPDVCRTSRPDNPGYLDGGLAALSEASERGWNDAAWVSLSNTDLEWISGDPNVRLAEHDHDLPVVLAPRITEGPTCIEKNPHVMTRRSLRRLQINRILTFSKYSTMAYQTAAMLRAQFGGGSSKVRRASQEWELAHPQGTRFYSPYGAVMFFSHGFAAASSLPRGIPLLAEEYFIAEAAQAIDAPVVYEPRIHVHHNAHTTTGPKVTARRAAGTSHAFKRVYEHARQRHIDGA